MLTMWWRVAVLIGLFSGETFSGASVSDNSGAVPLRRPPPPRVVNSSPTPNTTKSSGDRGGGGVVPRERNDDAEGFTLLRFSIEAPYIHDVLMDEWDIRGSVSVTSRGVILGVGEEKVTTPREEKKGRSSHDREKNLLFSSLTHKTPLHTANFMIAVDFVCDIEPSETKEDRGGGGESEGGFGILLETQPPSHPSSTSAHTPSPPLATKRFGIPPKFEGLAFLFDASSPPPHSPQALHATFIGATSVASSVRPNADATSYRPSSNSNNNAILPNVTSLTTFPLSQTSRFQFCDVQGVVSLEISTGPRGTKARLKRPDSRWQEVFWGGEKRIPPFAYLRLVVPRQKPPYIRIQILKVKVTNLDTSRSGLGADFLSETLGDIDVDDLLEHSDSHDPIQMFKTLDILSLAIGRHASVALPRETEIYNMLAQMRAELTNLDTAVRSLSKAMRTLKQDYPSNPSTKSQNPPEGKGDLSGRSASLMSTQGGFGVPGRRDDGIADASTPRLGSALKTLQDDVSGLKNYFARQSQGQATYVQSLQRTLQDVAKDSSEKDKPAISSSHSRTRLFERHESLQSSLKRHSRMASIGLVVAGGIILLLAAHFAKSAKRIEKVHWI